MPTPAPKTASGFKGMLTRKVGPAPAYVWYGVGVAGLAFVLYRRKQAQLAKAVPGTADGNPTSAANPATSIPNVPVQSLSGLPWQFGSFQPPTAANGAPATPNYTDTTQEQKVGSGYGAPPGMKTVTNQQGTFVYVDNPDTVMALLKSGVQIWYQPVQRFFVPGKYGEQAPGTPVFIQTTPPVNPSSSAPAGYTSPMVY